MPEPSNMLCISCPNPGSAIKPSRRIQCTTKHSTTQCPGINAPPLQTLHNELSSPLHKKPAPLQGGGCDVGVGWMDFPTPLLSSHRFRPRPKIRTFSLVFGQNWIKPLIPCCKAIKSRLHGQKEIQFWNMNCVRPNCCLLNFFYCRPIIEDKLTINSGHPIYRGTHRVDQCDTRTIAETDPWCATVSTLSLYMAKKYMVFRSSSLTGE